MGSLENRNRLIIAENREILNSFYIDFDGKLKNGKNKYIFLIENLKINYCIKIERKKTD